MYQSIQSESLMLLGTSSGVHIVKMFNKQPSKSVNFLPFPTSDVTSHAADRQRHCACASAIVIDSPCSRLNIVKTAVCTPQNYNVDRENLSNHTLLEQVR